MGDSIEDLIEKWFTYHAPTQEQQRQLVNVRDKAKEFALVILDNSPGCADQSAAFRLLRQCVMTVNASIVLEGK